jgi:hypothetical protein
LFKIQIHFIKTVFFFVLFLILQIGSLFSEEIKTNDGFYKVQTANIRILNKVTGIVTNFDINVNEILVYKNLQIMVRSCYINSYKTSHNAFIQVVKSGNINEEKSKNTINYTNIELPKDFKMLSDNNNKVYYIIFSGWMFADEPDISLMQDYDYDITLNRCVSDILPKDNLEIKKVVK